MPPRLRPRSASLLLVAALAALTCDDSRLSVPLSERVAQAFCAHEFNCCSPFEVSTLSGGRYQNEADCVEYAMLTTRRQLGTVEGAIAQGRITIDPARAEACLAAYANQPCNGNMLAPALPELALGLPNAASVLASCPDMLVGHVPNNQACNLNQECLRDSRCLGSTQPQPPIYPGDPSAGTVFATPGICVPYQRIGERCNQPADCEPTRSTCRAAEFTCGAKSQLGEPCFNQADMFTGAVTSNCDATKRLFCDDIFTQTCQRFPRDGELCSQVAFPQCDPDPALALSCNPFTGTCRSPGKEGDPCGGAAIPPCRADLACIPTQPDGIGTCGPIPKLGETCTDRCLSPAVCAGISCVAPGPSPIGAPCTDGAECASLSCSFRGTTRVCENPPYVPVFCVGAHVTAGNIGAVTGAGGSVGAGGTIGTGGRGGVGGRGGSVAPGMGCPISNIAPQDPLIADFDDISTIPIGGLFTFGSPSPTAMILNSALQISFKALGTDVAQFFGGGIFFIGDPSGFACIDATAHTGVQFDISGRIEGVGCSAQYATNDSIHVEGMFDPKGSGPPGAFAPQAPLIVTPTPTTMTFPFAGPGAPVGGNPAVPIDRSRLTGVQWQFTLAPGITSNCVAELIIDNVRFF